MLCALEVFYFGLALGLSLAGAWCIGYTPGARLPVWLILKLM